MVSRKKSKTFRHYFHTLELVPNKVIVIIVGVLLLVTQTIYITLQNELGPVALEYDRMEQKLQVLKKENQNLKDELYQDSSYSSIQEKAADMGLTQKDSFLFLR